MYFHVSLVFLALKSFELTNQYFLFINLLTFYVYQHRMAGLAVIEVAQKVSKAWRSFQAEWKYSNKGTSSKYGKRGRRRERVNLPSQNRGGAGCSTSSSSETSTSYGITEANSSARSMMSWHDVYSVAVKWRQISEPCDPVVWINKLRYSILFLIYKSSPCSIAT